MKHTPGPWVADLDETYSVREIDGGRIAICANLRGRNGLAGRREGSEVAANCRLMAAAPALLSALDGLLNALPSATTHPAIKAARDAIAKATS